MQTSTLPNIQEQLLENNRLIREDIVPVLSSLACNNRKTELVTKILALHHQPNAAGVVQDSENSSWMDQYLVNDRVLTNSLRTMTTNRRSSSPINKPLVVS